MKTAERCCPGCGLVMPAATNAHTDGYYNCSAEWWNVYAEVLGYEYGHVIPFGQVHALTVDTYAVQHAGGRHKAKSVAVHLAGLYAFHELGLKRVRVARLMQHLANHYTNFLGFDPPPPAGSLSIFDVALASDQLHHIDLVTRWSAQVWAAWHDAHSAVARFAAPALDSPNGFASRSSSHFLASRS